VKALCIIPARGGSKRIPRKNIRCFRGKPIIAWSIEAARASGLFEHVLVSTDDPEIAAVAQTHGAEVPFLRPAALADDHTPFRAVVNHGIKGAGRIWGQPRFTCALMATAPFLQTETLRMALRTLQSDAAHTFVFSACRFPYPVQRGFTIDPSGGVTMLMPEFRLHRSQDLPPVYHDAGQFYFGRTSAFLSDEPTFGAGSIPFVLPREHAQDIDDEEDWRFAERLHCLLTNDTTNR
jgi:pseudaminic acid cytidylyltransferase